MTTTGRVDSRRKCESCKARYKIGEPKASQTWPSRLHLTSDQVDLLLVAAAEYGDLTEEAGEYESAVEFIDWLRPDAVNRVPDPGGLNAETQRDRHLGRERAA